MTGPPPTAAVLLGFGRTRGDPATRLLTVLLTDPLPANRLRVTRMLEAAGHRCVVAPDWTGALGLLSRTPVDAVLFDLDCGGARGAEAAKQLRRRPPPIGHLPLLALSARRTPGLEATCRDAGFDALLHHPVDPPALEAALRAAVTRHDVPEPLDAAIRSELRGRLGPAALRERDVAAMALAGSLMTTLREAPGSDAVRDAAVAIEAACTGVGAVAAASASRALAAAPDRRPVLLPSLIGALMAARAALRRD